MTLRVSDHAVLRWLERVEGVNVHAIRRRIRRAVIRGVKEGACGVRLDGVQYNIAYHEDAAVVTTCHSPHERQHLGEPRLPRGGNDEGGE